MKSLTLSLGLLALAAAAPTNDTITVCMYLHHKYPQYLAFNPAGPYALLTLDNAATWTEINDHYWNVQNSNEYQSACTFFPATAQQVSDAVTELNKFPTVPFGLKGGGHNPAPGFSATADGVLISFAPNLADIVRTADGTHFVIGTGARWGDVYKIAGQTNQVVVGGRLGDIGVAGFALGGGLSYLSAQYGLTCDNVDNFEAVLANGTVVDANRTSHSDLWWALRGGGNQFAIITRLTMQAHPEGVNGQVWGGTRTYSPEKAKDVFRAIANFTQNYANFPEAAVIGTFQFQPLVNVLIAPLIFFFYDGPEPPAGVFDDFDAIDHLTSDTSTRSYYSLAMEDGGADLTGFGNSFRAGTFPNLPLDDMVDFYTYAFNTSYSQSLNDSLTNLDVQILGFDPQPLSSVIAQASNAQGGNALGLDPANGDRIWVEYDLVWLNQLCDDKCPSFQANVARILDDYSRSKYKNVKPTNYASGDIETISYNPVFMNDAAPDQGDQIYNGYGSENLMKLQALKTAYDPTGFFTNRQGGFKLPS